MKKRIEMRNENIGDEWLRIYSEKLCYLRDLTIVKAEGSGVIIKKVNKAVDNVVQSCGRTVQRALYNNMFMDLKLGLITWAAEG